jgi:hypothetical protein
VILHVSDASALARKKRTVLAFRMAHAYRVPKLWTAESAYCATAIRAAKWAKNDGEGFAAVRLR